MVIVTATNLHFSDSSSANPPPPAACHGLFAVDGSGIRYHIAEYEYSRNKLVE